MTMHLISCPFAHTRLEHLDASGFPTVSIYPLEAGPLKEWDEFKREHALGISSQRVYARAIGLLIDFRVAVRDNYAAMDQRALFFRGFADALVRGTIVDGDDATSLVWLPRSRKNSARIVAQITKFSDWVATKYETKPLNGTREATVGEWVAFWQAWRTVKSRSLHGHLKSAERDHARANVARSVKIRGKLPVTFEETVYAFPETNFADLIQNGFRRRSHLAWTTLRDILIALLLHEGGLRLSEVLHLWVGDVYEHPESPSAAVVRVFHPSEGLREYRDPGAGTTRRVTSAQYLRLAYGRVPLTDLPGGKAVGWKEPMLSDADEKYLHVFWRSEDAARLFMALYLRYIQLRPLVRHHPYLFVTTEREPMTVKAYEKVHASAVRRIGLVARKSAGTTPHGHRHAFGKWLDAAGAPRKVIKVAMHHKSPFSQDAYTVKDALETARFLLRLRSADDMPFTAMSITIPPSSARASASSRLRSAAHRAA